MVQMVVIIVLAVALVVCAVSLYMVACQLCKVRKNDRMKRAFLNNVSREIRTPLKSVVEMAGVLSKEDLYLSKDEKRNIADQLQYNANLIGTFIDEVLVFTEADTAHLLAAGYNGGFTDMRDAVKEYCDFIAAGGYFTYGE